MNFDCSTSAKHCFVIQCPYPITLFREMVIFIYLRYLKKIDLPIRVKVTKCNSPDVLLRSGLFLSIILIQWRSSAKRSYLSTVFSQNYAPSRYAILPLERALTQGGVKTEEGYKTTPEKFKVLGVQKSKIILFVMLILLRRCRCSLALECALEQVLKRTPSGETPSPSREKFIRW